MKKNLFLRVGALMLVATLASCGIFIGTGTTAKYVASANVQASGQVAKFSVLINDGEIANATLTPTTVNAGDLSDSTIWQATDMGGTAHPAGTTTGTITTNDGSLIAPGTGGKFAFKIENKSQVTVKVTISAATTANLLPTAKIVFSDTASGTYGADLSSAIGVITLHPGAAATTKDIYWKWPFTGAAGQDAADTALGIAATPPSLLAHLKVDVEQLD